MQRTYGTSPGEDPERVPLDLYVGIDCSGSMVNPRQAVSYPVLAGCVIALSALRAGARVMAVLSGHPGPHSATAGFVDNEREVLRILTGYLGTGYAFGIPLLADAFAARRPTDRPAHILIVSDHDIFAMLEEKTDGRTGWKIAQEALAAARGGGTFVLHMPPDWEPEKRRPAPAGVAGPRHPGVGGHRPLRARVQPPRLGGRGRGGRRVRHEGPPLEQLMRRLAECPPDFLAAAAPGRTAGRRAGRGGRPAARPRRRPPEPRRLEGFRRLQAKPGDQKVRNQARIVLVACWLLHDPWFLRQRRLRPPRSPFWSGASRACAAVQAERFVDDPDRREELARAALAALDLRPQGETEPQARDRRTTLDSVERARGAAEDPRRRGARAGRCARRWRARRPQEAAASYGRE